MEIIITLHRTQTQGNAVRGIISFPIGEKQFSYPTLENANFIIPAGRYPLKSTWSPKFKKFMPEIADVPERDGIRIHMGSKPEHSTGCVLVGMEAITNLNILFNYIKKFYVDEDDNPIPVDLFIDIC